MTLYLVCRELSGQTSIPSEATVYYLDSRDSVQFFAFLYRYQHPDTTVRTFNADGTTVEVETTERPSGGIYRYTHIFRNAPAELQRTLAWLPRPVQLGLCCINNRLRRTRGLFCSRKPTLKTLSKYDDGGVELLQRRARQNCCDLLKLLEWNSRNDIRVFRISSDLFPHKSNARAPDYDLDFAQDLLVKIGDYAFATGQRLTFHPGQYNVLGTPYEDKYNNTIRDLDWQCEVLDRMGLPPESVAVIHGGGLYGDKEKTIARWIRGFKTAPERVRRRLVLENCERIFNIEDCLRISRELRGAGYRLPVVFDTHHHQCYLQSKPRCGLQEDYRYYISQILETWKTAEGEPIRPKFHVSEQGAGRLGHHSHLVETLPDALLEIPQRYGVEIDIMIEAKGKEEAVRHLHTKYPHLLHEA